MYKLENYSTQSFQNVSYTSSKFIPNAEMSYINSQYGDYLDMYKLKFDVKADYPTVSQLVPLIDSLNLYYIRGGNANLMPSDRKEITISWFHTSYRTKNNFNYSIELKAGLSNNYFADSIITDSFGRTSIYTVNAAGRKYLRISGKINKALKFNKINQLQLSASPSFALESSPNSVNGIWNISNSVNFMSLFNALYTYKDWLTVNFRQIFYYYSSKQQVFMSSALQNDFQETLLSVNCIVRKKLTISSDIKFNSNNSSQGQLNKFTIWNANIGYRFFSNNSLELKVSALDLLHENNAIVYYGSGNKITTGFSNVLQQYFIATVTYYPRKFGK